jgi:hypothetical protein
MDGRREALNFFLIYTPVVLILSLTIFGWRVNRHYEVAQGILLFDLVLLLISIGIFWIVTKLKRSFGVNYIEKATAYHPQHKSLTKITKHDPEFHSKHFLYRVDTLAEKLNHAWCDHKMESVRNLVSAGIFNRFNIQLELMKKEGIVNVMQDWFLETLSINSVEADSTYHTIHVRLSARARDLNLPINLTPAQRQSKLLDVKQNKYTEIWSFVRRVNAKTDSSKFVLSGNCPSCGSNILNLGELNRCGHCKSIINSGEYDWVLAEITQLEEWKENDTNRIGYKFDSIQETNPDVNIQTLEDRVSYLFWRWILSSREKSSKPLQRNATEYFFKEFAPTSHHFDVAVGSVSTVELDWNERKIKSKVLVLWSGSTSIGKEPVHKEHYFYVQMDRNARKQNGLAGHSCEACGAPLPESNSLQCSYCSSPIPAIVNDWLLHKVSEL